MRTILLCFSLFFATVVGANEPLRSSTTDIRLEEFTAAALANDAEAIERHMVDPGFARLVDKDGHSALFVAAHVGRTDLATRLVESGANVNLSDLKGATAMYFAAANGQAAMVQWLIEHGANIAKSGDHAPLTVASMVGHVEVVRVLLKHGAPLFADLPTIRSSAALDVSATAGRLEVVRLLLDTKEAERMPEDEVQRLKRIAAGRNDRLMHQAIEKFEMARSLK